LDKRTRCTAIQSSAKHLSGIFFRTWL